jgi:hypothetical protein
MKKLLSLCFAMIIASSLSANLVYPGVFLSELYFDSTGNWVIELGFHNYTLEVLDSLQIESSSGSSTVVNYSLLSGVGSYPGFDSIAVITNANLSSPLLVDFSGDYVTIYSYLYGVSYEYSFNISFNIPNSSFPNFGEGFSIAYLYLYESGNYVYRGLCLDNSPTIGLPNDTIGALGTLKGRIFIDGDPVPAGTLKWYIFDDGTLYADVDENGYYTDQALARNYTCYMRQYFSNAVPTVGFSDEINGPFHYNIKPDQITEKDIHYNYSQSVDDFEGPAIDPSVFSFPNPFSTEISFYVDIPQSDSKNTTLEIYNPRGQKVVEFNLENNAEEISWRPDSEIAAGTYIYHLVLEGEILQSEKIIKQ